MDELTSQRRIEEMVASGDLIPATRPFFIEVPKMEPLAGGKTALELFLEERALSF
jgi:hypothetical protein